MGIKSRTSNNIFAPLVESLESRRLLAGDALTASAASELSTAATLATANIIAPTRAYLIGNSMTDGVRYVGFNEMLNRDGGAVSLGRQSGPGYSQSYNYNLKYGYFTSGFDPSRPTLSNPWGNYVEAFKRTWDALTVQPAERRLLFHDDPLDPGSTQNHGDVPMTLNFLKKFVVNSPNGQVFAYSRPLRRNDIDDNEQPTGNTFNYSAEWVQPYVDSGNNKTWNLISRSYTTQYMNLIRDAQKNDAATRNMKPVRLIPVGEAYYILDQWIKQGKFSGTYVKSITDFYSDKSHPRGDTGSYVIALAFYASITGNDPRGVSPPASYRRSNPDSSDAKVQSLIQQAVYEAMTWSGYAGWTTPMPDGPVVPPPPPPPPPTGIQSPYKGSPFAVGSTPITIQAEDFDNGGQSIAFHDVESSNLGGAYRSGGVDIQPTSDAGGGYNIGYVKPGEWLEYTIDAAAGNYDFAFRVANASSGGKFHFQIDGVDFSGLMSIPGTGGWQNFTTVTKGNVALTAGEHVLRVFMNNAATNGSVGNFNWIKISPADNTPQPPPPPPPPPAGQSPFKGSPFAIGSGTTTIQIEDFDNGGQGVAYHDVDSANYGGAYRSTGVDIQSTTDAGGGYNIGYVRAGEWLEYTINVATSGDYDFAFRVANAAANSKFSFHIDGADKSGLLSVPASGGFQSWTTVSKSGVSLSAGEHVLRVFMNAAGSNGSVGNFNWLKISPSDNTQPPPPPPPPPPSAGRSPYPGSPFTVGSGSTTIQFEDFDNGGQGIAYHDVDAANYGGAYRNTGVDIQSTTDAGGGYNIGYVRAGEWLEYTIDVATTGDYDFAFRVASAASNGRFSVLVNGVDKTGLLTVPNTGGFQSWTTINKSNVSLSAGQHVVRVYMNSASSTGSVGNFNWMRISSS